MSKQEVFLQKVEAALKNRIGGVIAGSILKNNLSKIDKDTSSLSMEDCRDLVANIVKSASLFETKDESKLIKTDLENILKTL